MALAVDIILSMALIAVGYGYTCMYLNKKDNKEFDIKMLKLTRNRILYLIVAVFAAGVLIGMFEFFYRHELLYQIKLLTLALFMMPIAAIDLRVNKIPNTLIIAALMARMLLYLVEFFKLKIDVIEIVKDSLVGACSIAGFFLFLFFIFKGSVGMGDIKLLFIMGLYQGIWGVINALFFSLLILSAVSIFLLITRKKGRKDTIAFGPSVFLGTIVGMAMAGM